MRRRIYMATGALAIGVVVVLVASNILPDYKFGWGENIGWLNWRDANGTADTRDDVVGCTTCHYAHAGPHPDILRWPPEEQTEACGSCHGLGRGSASRGQSR